ncbi:MAG TPA: IPT/TIG domain-containing protein, partial [Bryobacteraceae bacterium]
MNRRSAGIGFILMSFFACCGTAQAQISCNSSGFPASLLINSAYTLVCAATGPSPYTFTLSGILPPGMLSGQVGGEFLVEGAPAVPGTYTFTIQETDAVGLKSSQSFTETITSVSSGVVITSLSPATLTSGISQYLTISGSGFTPNSTAYLNGNLIVATFQSSNQLHIYIPASYLSPGTESLYITSSGNTSNTVTITVSASGGISLSTLSPASVQAGSSGFTLLLFGSGFRQDMPVNFGEMTLNGTFISAGELSVFVPASALTAAQTVNVSVSGSSSVPFTIGNASSGTLSVLCSPPTPPDASGIYFSQLCDATGGNGSYTWSTANLPAGLMTSAAGSLLTMSGTPSSQPPYTYSITVTDTSGHSGRLTLSNASSLSSLSPTGVPVGSPTFTLIVYGAGFDNTSRVFFNGVALPATLVSSVQLNATIFSSYLTAQQTVPVFVLTSGVPTSALSFTVGSGSSGALTLTSLSPAAVALNSQAITLSLFGSGFTPSQLVTFGNGAFSTSYINSVEATVTIPASYFTTPSTVNVSIGGSNALPFTIGASASLTITCTPSIGPAISAYFSQSCIVAGGIGPYTWTNTLPPGILPCAAPVNYLQSDILFCGSPTTPPPYTYSISATDLLGNTGTAVFSTPSYDLYSVSPSSAARNSGPITLVLTGSGFTSSSAVYFNSGPIPTTFVNSGQLNAVIPGSDLTMAQAASITVSTSGNSTNAIPFTVGAGSPLILGSISPSEIDVNSTAVSLTLMGSGFTPQTPVNFASTPLATTFVSTSQLVATIPSQYLTSPQIV